MKVVIITSGYREIGPEDVDQHTEEGLREAIAGETWQVADMTDAWRSNVDLTDTVTIFDDDGTVIWQGDL